MNLKTMLSPHPSAALEYWFFKFNSDHVALLVDWIAKRKTSQNWLRVSIHSPLKREVLSEKLIEIMPGDNFLSMKRTRGHLGDLSWELDCDPGNDMIKPDIFPAGILHMTDLLLVSAPMVRFTGWVRNGGEEFKLQAAPGMISHYWGRQLAPEWWWVSANRFDQEDVALECSFFHSSLWGTPVISSFAYLYLRLKDKKEIIMAPFGLASVKGSPENFTLEIKRIGKESITLTGTGREYGDLGDGIVNTLTGDLEIRIGKKLIAKALGTACLERRAKMDYTKL